MGLLPHLGFLPHICVLPLLPHNTIFAWAFCPTPLGILPHTPGPFAPHQKGWGKRPTFFQFAIIHAIYAQERYCLYNMKV